MKGKDGEWEWGGKQGCETGGRSTGIKGMGEGMGRVLKVAF